MMWQMVVRRALVPLLLVVVGLAVGAWWGTAHQAHKLAEQQAKGGKALAQMQQQLALCRADHQAQAAVINQLKTREADRLRQLQAARDVARAAMQARDALQAKLARAARAHQHTLQQVIHDTPNCQPLAALGVCPAVAGRLWSRPATTDTP